MITRRTFLWDSLLGAAAASAWGIPGVDAVTRGLSSTAAQGTAKKKVVILGAGLAGMVAALELIGAGHEVVILEATARAGGRVHTLREPFSDGLIAEAGAGRIPEWHNLTHKYIRDFGLQTEPFYPGAGNTVLILRGKRHVLPSDGDLLLKGLPFEFSAEEQRLTLDGVLASYVDPILKEFGDPAAADWPSPEIAKLDEVDWTTALRQRGASKGATDLLLALAGFPGCSALDFFRDDLGHRGAKSLTKIKGGNDSLPRAMSAKLQGEILYGAEVTRIQQSKDYVWINFTQAGFQRAYRGTHCLCTIPFPVLRKIPVAPAFSEVKREVIDKLYMDPVVRVYAQTKARIWEKQGLNGWASTDDPLDLWNPSFSQPGQRGLLHTYIEDGLTLQQSQWSVERRIEFSLAAMNKVFPGLDDSLESTYQWCWGDQPFERGAYTVFDVGTALPWGKIAREPEGRIHFAGEHTSAFPGWMQGAIESGLRAAREIHVG